MKERHYKKRRNAFFKQMQKNSVAVLFSAKEKIRSNDTEYPYRQDSDFYYFTGFDEDNCALVFVKKEKKQKVLLFVQKKDETLELWTGKRLGVKEAKKQLGADKTFDIDLLDEQLKVMMRNCKSLYFDLFDEAVYLRLSKIAKTLQRDRQSKVTPTNFFHVRALSHTMRLKKSKQELALISQALEITGRAHHQVMRMKKEGLFEYELQALFEYIFKKNGAKNDAYTTIVAGGENANTLHYIKNSDRLKRGDLILIDAGCEYGMYASDITRTIPVSGKFSTPQKELYEMVLEVELAVIKMIKPGVKISQLQAKAREMLCAGMVRLHILQGEVKTLLKDEKDRRYFPHGIGHYMGIDVHDTCPYRDKRGEEIPLDAGMVLTIEPGIYLPQEDTQVPEKYRGIGIRIEDNILVTQEGHKNLSSHIAKTVWEIEALYCS